MTTARLRLVCAAVAVAVALVVTAGWLTGAHVLVQVHPSWAPVQPLTAVGIGSLGVALVFLARDRREAAFVAATPALLVGVTTLTQYVAGIDLGVDTLFGEPAVTTQTSSPGRPAPGTAICLLLGWGALLPVSARHHLGAACAGIGGVSLFGYATGLSAAYAWGSLTEMALLTAVACLAIGAALSARTVVLDG